MSSATLHKPGFVREGAYGPYFLDANGDARPVNWSYGESRIPMTTSAFTAATVSTTGSPSVANSVDWAWRQVIVSNGTQAALIRQYAGLSGSANWLPGLLNQIDWSLEFRVRFTLRLDVGGTGSGFKWTLFIGGLNTAPTAHTMSNKGINFCVLGTGADAGTVQVGAHNGTTQVNSSAVAMVLNGTPLHFEIYYKPGGGLYLLGDGILVASVPSANLPAGLGTGSFNGWAFLMEHTTATNGTSTMNLTNLTVHF